MGAKYLPVANAQPPHNGFSFLAAKLWICIHGGHQDGCILIIFRLLCGQAMGVDVDIPCEGNIVIVVDQNDFTGQVSALAFVHLKMQISEVKEADLRQRLAQDGDILPGRLQLLRIYDSVGCQGFTDIHIRLVKRILLPESVIAAGLTD